MQRLTLAELEATTCLWTSGLLSLDLAAVACHKAFGTECLLVLSVNLDQGACDSQAESLRLTGVATAIEVHVDVVLLGHVEQRERLLHDELEYGAGEVLCQVALVDGNLASTFADIYAGNGALAAAQRISNVFRIHVWVYLYWLISIALGLCACCLCSAPP